MSIETQDMQIFLTRDGQKFGPYTQDDIVEYVNSGSVLRSDMAWHEGMTEWTKVGALGFLANHSTPPIPPTEPSQAPVAVHEPLTYFLADFPKKKKGIIAFLMGGVPLLISQGAFFGILTQGTQNPTDATQAALGFCFLGTGFFALWTLGLLWQMHHDGWKLLPTHFRTQSPTASAWLLFLPVFNIYWIFRSYVGLVKQHSEWLSKADITYQPQVTSGLAKWTAASCFIGFFPFNSLFLMWVSLALFVVLHAVLYARLFSQANSAWATIVDRANKAAQA